MPKTREQKEHEVSVIRKALESMKSLILTRYSNLTVAQAEILRKQCRVADTTFTVVKKNLLSVAFRGTPWEDARVETMEGSLAIMVSHSDEVAGAKVLDAFTKTASTIEAVGGILEGRWITDNEVRLLGKLPSRQELLGQVVGTLNAPLQNFVGVLHGTLRSFVRVLEAAGKNRIK